MKPAHLALAALFPLLCATAPLLAAPPAAQKAAPAATRQEAARLMKTGQPAHACRMYTALLEKDPGNAALLLGQARAATAAGMHDIALPAWHALLERFPNDNRLRSEAATAFRAAGKADALSEKRAAAPFLGPAIRSAQVGQQQRTQVSGKLRAGVLYDTNANSGPASDRMNLGDFRDITITDAGEKSTMGLYAGAQVDVAHRTSENGNWWVVGDAQAYWRGNKNSDMARLNSSEWQWGRIGAGMRYLDSTNLVDIRMKGEIFDYQLQSNVLSLGPEVTWLHVLNRDWHLITRAGLEHRDNNKSSARNSWYGHAGQYVRYFFGNARHDITIGVRGMFSDADNGDYSYKGVEPSASLTFRLPHGVNLTPHVSYTHENYEGPATALESNARRDRRLRTGLIATWQIDDAWSLEASYQYTNSHSESPLYDYDQHIVSAGIAWSF